MHCTCFKSGREILHGGRGVGMIDGRGVVVKKVYGEHREIELGRGFWPAKWKYESGALAISLVKKPFTGGVV